MGRGQGGPALATLWWRRPSRNSGVVRDGHRGRPGGWRGWASLMKIVAVSIPGPRHVEWPEHLPVGAVRVVRWSARDDQTVIFNRHTIGLPVLETFHRSYGLDGTILGLPGTPVHLEIVRSDDGRHRHLDLISWSSTAREHITSRLAAEGEYR